MVLPVQVCLDKPMASTLHVRVCVSSPGLHFSGTRSSTVSALRKTLQHLEFRLLCASLRPFRVLLRVRGWKGAECVVTCS